MKKKSYVLQSLALLTILTLSLTGCGSANSDEKASDQEDKKSVELLNVSYDPTRELYDEFNKDFKKNGRMILAKTSQSINHMVDLANRGVQLLMVLKPTL